MGCGCSYALNPLSKGCSHEARTKNIARLIREGYDARQAAAIAYSTQRKAGCKVPKRKAKRNPPYNIYTVAEQFWGQYAGLEDAVEQGRDLARDSSHDKVIVYDAGRTDRGPKGEFVAMFRPNASGEFVKKFGRVFRRGTQFGCCSDCGAVIELGARGGSTYWRDEPRQYCDGCKMGSPHRAVDEPWGTPGYCWARGISGVYVGGKFVRTGLASMSLAGGRKKEDFFVANKPKKRRRKKGKRSTYKSNPGVIGLAVLGLAAVGGWWLWKQYGAKAKAAVATVTSALPGTSGGTASQITSQAVRLGVRR